MKTLVNLITGFLGVGKTTAILHLLAQRPGGEPWAVLVNEFGAIGIDGVTLTESGVAVREVPGGCICCSAQLPLQVALTRLLREVKPARLLIEPTGLGHPAGVIDVLQTPALAKAIVLRNVICLIDPQQLADERFTALENYQDQMSLADVLVANKLDLASAEQTQNFFNYATQCYPPKRHVAGVRDAQLEIAWLDISGDDRQLARLPAHEVDDFVSHSWRFAREQIFMEAALRELFARWAGDDKIVRAKGVFRVGKDWHLLQVASGRSHKQSIAYRGDSVFEMIQRAPPAPAWDVVEQGLRAALRMPNSDGQASGIAPNE